MATTDTQCTGNCMGCTIFQRQYCASQIAYNNMRMMERISESLTAMGQELQTLKELAQRNPEEPELINPIG